jgi:hypothetical protein
MITTIDSEYRNGSDGPKTLRCGGCGASTPLPAWAERQGTDKEVIAGFELAHQHCQPKDANDGSDLPGRSDRLGTD